MSPLARRTTAEHLDAAGHDPRVLAESLAHVGAVDRWLGGGRAVRRHLKGLAEPGPARLTVLDVGTGDGVVLERLARWLLRRGHAVRAVGVDHHPEVVAVANRPRQGRSRLVHLVRADGLRLPLADRSVDVALATLTLHHFAAEQAVELVREMARVSRRAVLISDLERSRLHYLGARVLSATLWRGNPVTRHDGPLSVLRSFTPDELRTIGHQAGLSEVRVVRHAFFRLVLEGRP